MANQQNLSFTKISDTPECVNQQNKVGDYCVDMLKWFLMMCRQYISVISFDWLKRSLKLIAAGNSDFYGDQSIRKCSTTKAIPMDV